MIKRLRNMFRVHRTVMVPGMIPRDPRGALIAMERMGVHLRVALDAIDDFEVIGVAYEYNSPEPGSVFEIRLRYIPDTVWRS